MIKLLRPIFNSIAKQESQITSTSSTTTPSIQEEEDQEEKPSTFSPSSVSVIETEFSRSPFDEKFPFHRGDDGTSLPPRTETAIAAPFIQVTQEAEDEWYDSLRKEMSKLIWEPKNKDGKVVSTLRFFVYDCRVDGGCRIHFRCVELVH